MHLDDDSKTTLSKWPFILGDFLLVATGLAIAILGDWQLSNWQVGACVAAVGLGAALFVLPYVVEFQVRVREEQEDRAADIRIIEKRLLQTEENLGEVDRRARALALSVAEIDPPNPASTEIVDQKIALLEKSLEARNDELEGLQNDFKELSKKAECPPDFKVPDEVEKRLRAVEARLTALLEKTESDQQAATPKSSSAEQGGTQKVKQPKKTLTQVERPKRSTRKRPQPEKSRLLQRAITERSDNSSAAVSRIIGARAKEVESDSGTEPEVEESKPKQEATAGESEKDESSAGSESRGEPEERGEPDETKAEPASAKTAEPADTQAPGMLFDEEKITSPVIRTKAKKNDVVITASVFIGIGNKPYLRGGGGGLSWEKGKVMEFEEIGKWRWVAPPDLEAPLEIQIFRNDEDPDTTGKYKLEPGQKLEIAPVF